MVQQFFFMFFVPYRNGQLFINYKAINEMEFGWKFRFLNETMIQSFNFFYKILSFFFNDLSVSVNLRNEESMDEL